MAFTLVTNQITIARTAGALFGLQVGATNMTSYVAQATAATSVDAFLNAVYVNSIGTTSTSTVAAAILANLGIPVSTVAGSAGKIAQDYVVAALNAALPAVRGAAIKQLLSDFSALTADTTFGTYATTFNTKVTNAVTYATVAGNADGVYADVSSSVAAVVGTTFTLTTGTNSFTGTTGADTFDAGISSSSLQTLNSGDSLDGGAGTDTLYAVVTGSVTPAALKNIEDVYITNTTNAATVDFSNATGLSTVSNSASTVGLTLSGLSKSGPAVTVRDTNQSGQVVAFNDVTGSADSATVYINNLTSGSALTVAGVETLTLNSAGSSANVIGASGTLGLITAATKTLNITGTVGLTLATTGLLPTTNQVPSTIVNFDASANTSTSTGITASLAATASTTIVGAGGNDTFISLSAGTDSITLGAGTDSYTNVSGFTTADTINGGDGTDTLVSTSAMIVAASAATPTTYTVTNIETISISDAFTAASYTPANISTSATRLNILGATLNNVGVALAAGGVTMTTVGPAGSFTLGLGNTTTTGALGVLGAGDIFAITDTGTAITDSLTIENRGVNATSGAQLAMFGSAVIGVTGYETVTINNGSVGSVPQLIGTITLAGDQSANTTLILTGANTLTTAAITATVIDASALSAAGTTGAPTLTMSGVNTATTITGSAGIDVLIGHASSATSITAGAGADTITGGSGNDTILGGAGNDSITAGSGNDSINAGDGNDTITMAGNLASGDVIDGGAGTDTLLASAAIAAAAAASVTNVEVIGFTATVSQDMTAFLNAGITTLQETTGALTVTNAQTSLTTLILGAAGPSAVTGANLTRLVDGTADSLSVLLLDGTTGGTTLLTPSLANEETLTIGESGTDSTAAVTFALGTVTATSLTTLNITGSNDHTMTLSGETALATVAASSATGTLSILGGNSAVNMTVTGPSTTAMTIVTGSGNDSITGGSAADILTGGTGNDTIIGGAGADTINNGAGIDSLVGGDGSDTLTFSGITIGTTLDGGTTPITGVVVNLSTSAITATTIAGHVGNTVVVNQLNTDVSTVAAGTSTHLGLVASVSARVDTLSGFEVVTGTSGKDYIVGSSSANTITGAAGADVMVGGSGADTFIIGAGASIALTAETMTEAAILAGETMVFANGVDVITDFTSGTDFLDVVTATNYTLISAGGALLGRTIGSNYSIRGTYTASSGSFAQAAAGADSLVITSAVTTTVDGVLELGIVILVGTATLTTADFI